jgi:hypothetical protein
VAADVLAAAGRPLCSPVDAVDRALIFESRRRPEVVPGGRGPLPIGDPRALVDFQAEAPGGFLELLILVYERLELTQALGHPLFGAAD